MQSRPPISKNKFIPPQDLHGKGLPPIPETEETDLEKDMLRRVNCALLEEISSLRAQLNKFNEIFSERDSGPATVDITLMGNCKNHSPI
jgi:hypothetical protein